MCLSMGFFSQLELEKSLLLMNWYSYFYTKSPMQFPLCLSAFLSWYKSEVLYSSAQLVDVSKWGGWGPPETGGCTSPSFLQGAAAPQLQLWGHHERSLCSRKTGNSDFCGQIFKYLNNGNKFGCCKTCTRQRQSLRAIFQSKASLWLLKGYFFVLIFFFK